MSVTDEDLPMLAGVKARNAILDSGVSYSIIPSRDFILIQQGLEDGFGMKCNKPTDGASLTSVYECSCNSYSALPDIQIGLEE